MDNRMEKLEKKINNRKKYGRTLSVLKKVIAFLLIFSLGFGCGVWFKSGKSIYNLIPDRRIETEKEPAKETAGNDKKASATKEKTDKIPANQELLQNISGEYISLFEKLYPNATLSFLIKDLDTGAIVMHNNTKLNSASLIKLFIMETVYKQVQKGDYVLDDEKRNALEIMISDSDNESANFFIDEFGGVDNSRKVTSDNIINKTIMESGYTNTEINRKMHDSTPPEGPSGYQNYTCVEDVAILLEGIYNDTLLKKEYTDEAMGFLDRQSRKQKIPSKIKEKYPEIIVANKTGELTDVENDAAIIMAKDFNLMLVVMVNDIPKEQGINDRIKRTIGDFGLILVEKYMGKDSR